MFCFVVLVEIYLKFKFNIYFIYIILKRLGVYVFERIYKFFEYDGKRLSYLFK